MISEKTYGTRTYHLAGPPDVRVAMYDRPLRGYKWICISITAMLCGLSLFSATRRDHRDKDLDLSRGGSTHNYFGDFKGFPKCDIHGTQLYLPPLKDNLGFYKPDAFCRDRKHLLHALSDGGRIGFDAPYQPLGCNYRWFDVEDICFILERFDSIVFVGDHSLRTVYNGLNILLRQDLAHGTLNLATMREDLREECRCNNQFIKQECEKHYLLDSKAGDDDHTGSKYFCNHVRHTFLYLESTRMSPFVVAKLQQLLPNVKSRYQPIPIIHSLSPNSATAVEAGDFQKHLTELADDSGRNTPMLWVGPTAAGHIDTKGRKGNQDIWEYDRQLVAIAEANDLDVLGMWNFTVQATSWDGTRFGEKVAITQAMMVLNWLSRLESN